MSYNHVTVTGKYTDSLGNPASGKVEWFPTAPIVDSTNHVTIAEPVDEIQLDSTGSFSVSLIANDDPGLNAFGWAFRPYVTGVPDDVQYVSVLYANGATQFLDQLPGFNV